MKLAIIGSRDLEFKDYRSIVEALKLIDFDEVVSGGAKGADSLAELYASDRGLKLTVFPADWKKHGKAAGPIRNTQIAEYADRCFAFVNKPLEQSRGTNDCVKKFKALGKDVTVFQLEGE